MKKYISGFQSLLSVYFLPDFVSISIFVSVVKYSILQNTLDDYATEAIELLYKNIVILCQNSYFCLICYYVVLERVCDLSLIVCFVWGVKRWGDIVGAPSQRILEFVEVRKLLCIPPNYGFIWQ